MFLFMCWLLLDGHDDRKQQATRLSFSEFTLDEYQDELTSILRNPVVCKELEISDSQMEKINKAIGESHEIYQRNFEKLRKTVSGPGDPVGFSQNVKKLIQEDTERITGILNRELLPNQVKAIDRLVLWSLIRVHQPSASGEGFEFRSRFQDESIREILKISTQQSARIEARANALQDDFHKELANLHDKYDQLMSQELRQDQRQLGRRILGKTPPLLFKDRPAHSLSSGSKGAGGFF